MFFLLDRKFHYDILIPELREIELTKKKGQKMVTNVRFKNVDLKVNIYEDENKLEYWDILEVSGSQDADLIEFFTDYTFENASDFVRCADLVVDEIKADKAFFDFMS